MAQPRTAALSQNTCRKGGETCQDFNRQLETILTHISKGNEGRTHAAIGELYEQIEGRPDLKLHLSEHGGMEVIVKVITTFKEENLRVQCLTYFHEFQSHKPHRNRTVPKLRAAGTIEALVQFIRDIPRDDRWTPLAGHLLVVLSWEDEDEAGSAERALQDSQKGTGAALLTIVKNFGNARAGSQPATVTPFVVRWFDALGMAAPTLLAAYMPKGLEAYLRKALNDYAPNWGTVLPGIRALANGLPTSGGAPIAQRLQDMGRVVNVAKPYRAASEAISRATMSYIKSQLGTAEEIATVTTNAKSEASVNLKMVSEYVLDDRSDKETRLDICASHLTLIPGTPAILVTKGIYFGLPEPFRHAVTDPVNGTIDKILYRLAIDTEAVATIKKDDLGYNFVVACSSYHRYYTIGALYAVAAAGGWVPKLDSYRLPGAAEVLTHPSVSGALMCDILDLLASAIHHGNYNFDVLTQFVEFVLKGFPRLAEERMVMERYLRVISTLALNGNVRKQMLDQGVLELITRTMQGTNATRVAIVGLACETLDVLAIAHDGKRIPSWEAVLERVVGEAWELHGREVSLHGAYISLIWNLTRVPALAKKLATLGAMTLTRLVADTASDGDSRDFAAEAIKNFQAAGLKPVARLDRSIPTKFYFADDS